MVYKHSVNSVLKIRKPVESVVDPYLYYLIDPAKTDENKLHYIKTLNKEAIIESKTNELIVIDMNHEVVSTAFEAEEMIRKKIMETFIERLGHTITEDERQFGTLFVSRIYSGSHYRSSIQELLNGILGFSSDHFYFILHPQLYISSSHLYDDKAQAQLIGYVTKHKKLDLSETSIYAHELNYCRLHRPANYRIFNENNIFIRPSKRTLEYDPKRAAQQAKRYRKKATRDKHNQIENPSVISYIDIRNFYHTLQLMIEWAIAGEELSERRLSKSRVSTARRSMALIPVVDAIYDNKLYLKTQAFYDIKCKIKKLLKHRPEKLDIYNEEFIELFKREIKKHPGKPRKLYDFYGLRAYGLLKKNFKKQFKYVQKLKH